MINITNDNVLLLTKAMLNLIKQELDREYWNLYQKEMISPFDNTGAEYTNNYVKIRAYHWGDDEDEVIALPNFETEKLHISWYKHSNRGLSLYIDEKYQDNVYELLANELFDCIKSIEKDFKNRKIEGR